MREVSSDYPFFEYFEKHFKWHKKSCVITKLPKNSCQLVKEPMKVASQKIEELVKKEQVTSPPDITLASVSPKLNALEAHVFSSSSSRTSSEKEKEQLDDQLQSSSSTIPKKWISKYRRKETSENFH